MQSRPAWCPQEGLESSVVPLIADVVRVRLRMSNRSNYFNASAGRLLGGFSLKAWPPNSCSSALPFTLRASAAPAVGVRYQDCLWQASAAEQEDMKNRRTSSRRSDPGQWCDIEHIAAGAASASADLREESAGLEAPPSPSFTLNHRCVENSAKTPAWPTGRRFFFFLMHPHSSIFIQSPASVHATLPTPRRYLGTHSHFVAPHPLTITEALPFLPFVFPSSPCPTLINPHLLLPHPPLLPPSTSHQCSLVTYECWPGIYFLLLYLLSVSLHFSSSISTLIFWFIYLLPTIPKQMATLSPGQKQWLWTTALRGAVFTLTLDLISWYPARNVICQWQKCINHIAQCSSSHLRLQFLVACLISSNQENCKE